MTLCFSLAALKIFLSLTFAILIMICCCGSLWVHLVWDSLRFLDPNICFLLQIREIFSHYFIKYVFYPFLSLFSFWGTYNMNVSMLDVVPEVPLNYPHFKNVFFLFCCSGWVVSTILSSRSLIHSSVLPNLLLIPSNFHFSYCILQLFFIFSNSLLKFSLCSSVLLLSLVSILMTIALNSLSGKLLLSISLG